jgi:HEAT repeat protein
MTDDPYDRGDYEEADEPPDPQVLPEHSPGFGEEMVAIEDLDIGRDVDLGTATLRELCASDVEPLARASEDEQVERLLTGDHVERRRAALAIAEGGSVSDDAVGALARACLTDDDSDVRQFAVESLGKVGGERTHDAVLECTDDEDPWVRAEAVVALDRLDREAFQDRIEAALDDDHHAVRRNAAISLFKLRGEDTLAILLDQLDDESERVREWAAHLLGGIDDDRARTALERVASDESEPRIVASTAARALKADPGAFRRQFSGAIDQRERTLPGEDRLNRQPDL